MNRREKPVFSNLVEQDSGLVTAGNTFPNASSNSSEDDVATDLYRPEYNVEKVRTLMAHGIEEYNKANPTIRLALYTVSHCCFLCCLHLFFTITDFKTVFHTLLGSPYAILSFISHAVKILDVSKDEDPHPSCFLILFIESVLMLF